ncbi:MAG TPA: DUF2075 domain-containing protein [Candidatus Coprosoma intestinipullorum]|uniref:DUF2075 domain-containing protein n=1 Tax=Candidatus Coprosoma intestinipullorum TaxID=2840752 RepID=A0A9D0ZQK9_9FIRM|nr:DUF2075 domain-containing protein [Candidatus Coprosoma intestinipullorum]
MNIKTLKFNDGTPANLRNMEYGTNWPVVYIINNDKEAYIGETTDVSIRSNQHLANTVRRNLDTINVITDKTFNKSVILDLESFLIKYMAADKKYKLQNGNGGMQNHNYYQRKIYEKEFKNIWIQLKSKGLVKHDLKTIENSDLFKYSPYKTLTVDQYMIANDILSVLSNDIKNKKTSLFLVHGGFGTGKTILGIYLLKLLSQAKDSTQIEVEDEELEYNLSEIINNEAIKKFRIGLVIPMNNLRATLKKVFKDINGLDAKMVLSPNDVAKSDNIYDLLIVDEAHRLRRRQNLTQYKSFDNNNKKLNLGDKGTELDWILLKSKYQILLYDENQSIKPTDVRKEDFEQLMLRKNYRPYYLETQLRCLLGGNEYVDYIKNIFSNNPPEKKVNFKKYDFKIFDNINDLIEEIKQKDKEYGLCRNIAGFAWPWKSKEKKLPSHITKREMNNIVNNGIYDIEIDGEKYIWNTKTTDWINSSNSVNEIGSIHTIQGYDLNYAGVIIGNELKYDNKKHKFIVDRKKYYDVKGKSATSDEDLLQYILNIYCTMCTRGMLGTYLYVCDKELKKYLQKYVSTKHK